MDQTHRNFLYRSADTLLKAVLRVLPVTSLSEKVMLSWGYRYRPGPTVVKLRSGLQFEYTAPDYIPLWLYYFGTFEPHALAYANRAAHGTGVIMDVGANIGFYSVELASRARRGRVIAIEPVPHLAASVRRNVALNGFTHVEVLQVAVGEVKGGSVKLELPEKGNFGMYSVAAGPESNGVEVPLSTIDDIAQDSGLNALDLIKMDIEGSELRALKGATQTLRRFRPTILMELNEPALSRCGGSSAEVKEFLGDLGYTGWRVTRQGPRRISMTDDHYCDECVFVHQRRPEVVSQLELPE